MLLNFEYDSEEKNCFCLFSGDLTNTFWRTVKNRYIEFTRKSSTKLIYLKIAHHGGKNFAMHSPLSEMFSKEENIFASISCPSNNFKHPHESTLQFLQKSFNDIKIACTNKSNYCIKKGFFKKNYVDSFLEKSEIDEQFDEFAKTETSEFDECAGNHTFVINKVSRFTNSTEFYCKLV